MKELCTKIELQEEVMCKVLEFTSQFDFESVRSLLDDLKDAKKEQEARGLLKEQFGCDKGNIKILSCMLQCAVELYEYYQQKGINERIYIDTMKCFTRFINECKVITGEYAFDREWWTSRQIGGRLFRIGELEYEMTYNEEKPVVSVHIPSDAEFTVQNCDESINMAKIFFRTYYHEYSTADYLCYSWLLAPELSQLLQKESNILQFQKRFHILKEDYELMDIMEWLFQTKDKAIENLPERTSLQKNMKNYLLSGGKIGNALGIMR